MKILEDGIQEWGQCQVVQLVKASLQMTLKLNSADEKDPGMGRLKGGAYLANSGINTKSLRER